MLWRQHLLGYMSSTTEFYRLKPTDLPTSLGRGYNAEYTSEAKSISDMQDAISSGALMSQVAEPEMLTKIKRLRAQVPVDIVKADEINEAINTARP